MLNLHPVSKPTPHLQPRTHTVISNALDLNRYTLGQLLDRNAATRRLVREELLKHAVHLGEVCHVVEEDVDLDDVLDGCVGLLQDGDDVLAAQCCLVGDAALDQGAGLVGGDLAGDEDVGPGDDGLGLWGVSGVVEQKMTVRLGSAGWCECAG